MPIPPALLGIGRLLGAVKLSEIGTELISGVADHPALKGLVLSIAESIVPGGIATYAEMQIKMRADYLQKMAGIRAKVEETAGPAIAALMAAGLKDYFGIDIDPRALKGQVTSPDPNQAARALGQGLLTGLFGSLQNAGTMSPEIGTQNMERVLSFAISNAIEGWLIGTLGVGYFENAIPNVGDLGDLVTQSLGTARIVRRALTPALDALIVEPAQQDFRRRFRSTLPSPAQAARLHTRGRLTFEEYHDIMARHGYTMQLAHSMMAMQYATLGRTDLRRMLAAHLLTDSGVIDELKRQGYAQHTAEAVLTLIKNDKLESLQTSIATVGRDMFRDREIEEPELRQLAAHAGYTLDETEALVALGKVERSRPRQLTQSTMERAYKEGLIDLQRLSAWYRAQGYAEADVDILEALAVDERADQETRDKAKAARRPAPTPGAVTVSVAEESFRRGILEEAALRAIYADNVIPPAEVEIRLSTGRQQRQEYAAAVARRTAPKRGITATAGTIEDAYVRGLVQDAQLEAWYVEKGFQPRDIPLLLQLRRAERAEWMQRQARAAASASTSTKPRA